MNAIVSEAHAWTRKVAAHCHGDKAAKMAIAAGVDSIEHGSFLQDDTLQEMKKKHVYLVATLFAATGWVSISMRIRRRSRRSIAASKRVQQMFEHALKIGVPIAMGTDAGVEPHGLNATEFSLMTKYGMAGAGADRGYRQRRRPARHRGQDWHPASGQIRDIVAVPGNPLTDMKVTEHPLFVMKEGTIYRNDRAAAMR